MKKLGYILTLSVAMAVAAVTMAKAQILTSVNFQGGDTGTLAPVDMTGATGYVGGNWNNETGTSGGPLVLNDSSGFTSDVTLTSFAAGPFGVNGPDTDNSSAQKTLFGGSLGVNFGPATFTISGLSAYSSYDLVVYYTGGTSFADSRDANITASGSSLTYYVAGDNSAYTSFDLSNSTDSSTFASGNYVVFSGLTAATETVAMNYVNNNMGLVGFQVTGYEESAPVPEPSTWALMLGGLALLVGVQRLRRVRS